MEGHACVEVGSAFIQMRVDFMNNKVKILKVNKDPLK